MPFKIIHPAVAVLALICVPHAAADVQEFENKSQWQGSAGAITTITFTEFAPNQIITNQYADWGIEFVDGTHFTFVAESFVNDGVGMGTFPSSTTPITIDFSQPMTSIGADFPGGLQIKLYSGDSLVFTSEYSLPPTGTGNFLGVVSTAPFTRVELIDLLGGVSIDDLHFGPPIPSPGSLCLFGVGVMCVRHLRRRCT